MSRNGAHERERLFDLYARQLELGGVTPTGIFVCPLCREGWTRESLCVPDPGVSLAHVVPEALGGRLRTLACTPCNNGNGARLEADLARSLAYQDWVRGVGSWPARLRGEFGDLGIEFRRSEGLSRWSLTVVEGQTNPACVSALDEWLAANRGQTDADIRWNITWSVRTRHRNATAAIYQSAYLMMFAYFGYDFALRDHYEPLRRQVLRPDERAWPGHIALLSPSQDCPGDGAVMFVRRPKPCVCVMLRFRPPSGSERLLGVILPGPDEQECRVPELSQGELDGTVVPYRPDVLATRPWYFAGLWRYLQARVDG